MQALLICFVGIDGCGKTTISKKVTKILKQKDGIKCQYVYGRVVPVASRILMWIGRKMLLKSKEEDMFSNYTNYISKKKRAFQNKLASRIYEFFVLFDQIIQINLKITPLLLARSTVICDRYLYDAIITDLAVDLEYSNDDIKHLVDRLLRLVPKPDIIFLIDIPEEVAFLRKKDIPHLDYLRKRRKLYCAYIQSQPGTIILDGTKDIDELCSEVYENIAHLK